MPTDNNFTETLRQWLDNTDRSPADGALLILRLRGNHVEYRQLMKAPERYADYIYRTVKRFHDFRASRTTHEQVKAKVAEAEAIAEKAAGDPAAEAAPLARGKEAAARAAEAVPPSRSGKRPDHDALPPEIQQCYVDNLDLHRRISDAHTKIRLIIRSAAPCKDADLLPFAQEIIRLDKKRLANWQRYDTYQPTPES